MPVPTHFRFVFRGAFNGTPEEWSFGMHFKRDIEEGADAGPDQIDQGAVTGALSTLLQGGQAPFASNIWATDWRAYQIGTNGRMEGQPVLVDLANNVTTRGTVAAKYPLQIALCVTTVAENRGAARFGRFYLPGTTPALAADMRISEAAAGDYAESCTTFVKAVADAIDLPLSVNSSEMLNISTRGAVEGTKQTVHHLEVGRVLDTIRSRRNKLLEERHIHGAIDW